MYTCDISSTPLTREEKLLFRPHLLELGMEHSIWDVYDKFLEIQTKYSKPKIIRIYRNNEDLAEILRFLRKKYLLLIIHDLVSHAHTTQISDA
jgi:intein-encoded DNA endonuclease-like protein